MSGAGMRWSQAGSERMGAAREGARATRREERGGSREAWPPPRAAACACDRACVTAAAGGLATFRMERVMVNVMAMAWGRREVGGCANTS